MHNEAGKMVKHLDFSLLNKEYILFKFESIINIRRFL